MRQNGHHRLKMISKAGTFFYEDEKVMCYGTPLFSKFQTFLQMRRMKMCRPAPFPSVHLGHFFSEKCLEQYVTYV